MMAINTSSVICVLLCVVCAVTSVKIRGTIADFYNPATEVEVSEYIDGNEWNNTYSFTLNRLIDGEDLPTLTLTNFQSLNTLNITSIALEHVPVFENISSFHIFITRTKIKYVPTNAFTITEVRVIYLDNNEIQSMSDRSVNQGVAVLSLRCNKLREFSQAWFKDPNTIYTLDLSGNQIEQIQDHAFNQMTELYMLKLSNNRIARIGIEAFGSRIIELHLHFNNIAELMPDMFANPHTRIEVLYLHHNQLSFLAEALFLKLQFSQISLDGNPWQCQCLRNIERWIGEWNITRRYLLDRRSEPVCVEPLSFQNLCVPTVDKELRQTYARGLSPVQGCLATPCHLCPELGLNMYTPEIPRRRIFTIRQRAPPPP